MANRLTYLPIALKEFDESFAFYEERTTGLGIRFRNQIIEKLIVSQFILSDIVIKKQISEKQL